ncbi:hypothetical protein SAMN05518669_11017 [Variovorax sp. YR634]|uniref:DUF6339 family protein n=1 Tax=Variovorax sp. YR634 TaxID=1884385 RepID=UPI00089C72A6|nr:DUF6339 family protein [Variovorax sp. YR634]SDY18995.1 hypothetical protein SAMN05518669_11017 [Variovorax sp. YR634]
MLQPLKLLSTSVVEKLLQTRSENLNRYSAGDFLDLEKNSGWAIETKVARWDPEIVHKLIPESSPEAELRNSRLIYEGLEGMTPALARDERIWARLCHVECLDYSRARWLRKSESLDNQVRLHFFAHGLPGCRDDNAIGRLWWNGHVARLASPGNLDLGLERLLARANIRLQIIDRADTAFRQPLIEGIVRLLGDQWFSVDDAAVADFMYEVNKRSGGIVFEALPSEEIDAHLAQCLNVAKERRTPSFTKNS